MILLTIGSDWLNEVTGRLAAEIREQNANSKVVSAYAETIGWFQVAAYEVIDEEKHM